MYDNKPGIQNSVIIYGLIVSVLTLLLSKTGAFEPIYPVFKSVIADFQISNLSFFQKLSTDLDFFSGISKFREENDQLKAENQKLISINAELQTSIKDLQKISRQLNFNQQYRQEPVRIIKFSESQSEVMVNKGVDFGVKVDDIAVIESNLVGIVTETGVNFSRVRLIIDKQSKVPALIVDNNAKGFALGQNSSEILVQGLQNDKTISPGALVVSAGTDAVVPYGLVIGKVERTNSNPTQITQEAVVKSPLHFNDLSELFILIK